MLTTDFVRKDGILNNRVSGQDKRRTHTHARARARERERERERASERERESVALLKTLKINTVLNVHRNHKAY